MSQEVVITVEDITNVALEERRPGCEKVWNGWNQLPSSTI
jgi:hypothetical protein